MSKWTKFGTVVLGMALVVGCGDDDGTNPNTTTLTTGEKTALTNALASTEFGALAGFVIQVVGEVGTLDAATVSSALQTAFDQALSLSTTGAAAASYTGAVGIALEFDLSAQGQTESGWFYGVFGWNDINTTNNTVGEWVIVGAAGETGSLPSSASGDITDGDLFANYFDSPTYYFGTSGSATIGGSFGGSGTDCGTSAQGVTVECEYTAGTMNGNFAFSAEQVDGSATYTQPSVQWSGLPAVKLTLSITQ